MMNGSDNKAVNTLLSTEEKGPGPSLLCLTPPLIERTRLLHSTAATKQEHNHTYRSKEEEKGDLSEAIIASADEI